MKKITLFLLDLIALYASLIITLFIRYRSNTKEFNALFEPHLISFSVIFIVWLVVFYIAGLYDQRNFRNTAQFYSGFFRTISVAGAVSVIFFYLIPIFGITPKTNLFIFIVIFTLLESANRYLFNNVAEKKFKKPMLIVGASPQAVELAKFITDNPQFGYDLKYLVNLNSGEIGQSNNFGEIPIIEGAAELEQIVTDAKINTIIIGPEAYQAPEIINVFYKSLEHKITFYSLASFY